MKRDDSQACAACFRQRRPCGPDCLLAEYFPASQQENFKKMMRTLSHPKLRKTYIQTIIAQATENYRNNLNVDPLNAVDRNIGEGSRSQPLVQLPNEDGSASLDTSEALPDNPSFMCFPNFLQETSSSTVIFSCGNPGEAVHVKRPRTFSQAQNEYGARASRPLGLSQTARQPFSSGVSARSNLGEGMRVEPFNQAQNAYGAFRNQPLARNRSEGSRSQPLVQLPNVHGAASLQTLEALCFPNFLQETSSSTGIFSCGNPGEAVHVKRPRTFNQAQNEYGARASRPLGLSQTARQPFSSGVSARSNLGEGMRVEPFNQAQNAYGAFRNHPLARNRSEGSRSQPLVQLPNVHGAASLQTLEALRHNQFFKCFPRILAGPLSSSRISACGNLGEGKHVGGLRPFNQVQNRYGARASRPLSLNQTPEQPSSSGVSAHNLGRGLQARPFNQAQNAYGAFRNQTLDRDISEGSQSQPLVQLSNRYTPASLETLAALPDNQFFKCFSKILQEPLSSSGISTRDNFGEGMRVRPFYQAQNAYGARAPRPLDLSQRRQQPSPSGVSTHSNLDKGMQIVPFNQAQIVYNAFRKKPMNRNIGQGSRSQPLVQLPNEYGTAYLETLEKFFEHLRDPYDARATIETIDEFLERFHNAYDATPQPLDLTLAPQQPSSLGVSAHGNLGEAMQVVPFNQAQNVYGAFRKGPLDRNIGEGRRSQPLVQLPNDQYGTSSHETLVEDLERFQNAYDARTLLEIDEFLEGSQNAYDATAPRPLDLTQTPQQPSSSGVSAHSNLGEGMQVVTFNQAQNAYRAFRNQPPPRPFPDDSNDREDHA